MEAFAALSYSSDHTISSYKRNPNKRNIQTNVPHPSANFSPANLFLNLQGKGLLLPPPPQPKPPLLPLPINNNNNKPCSQNRKISKVRNQDFTVKKPKPSSGYTPKKQEFSRSVSMERLGSEERLGDLPKEVSRVMKPYVAFQDIDEKFSPSVFYLSPPPSSLPLPKFTVRPKLSCNAEAGGVDAGATDNLRRLLRLQ